jgi:hypothetical protein
MAKYSLAHGTCRTEGTEETLEPAMRWTRGIRESRKGLATALTWIGGDVVGGQRYQVRET